MQEETGLVHQTNCGNQGPTLARPDKWLLLADTSSSWPGAPQHPRTRPETRNWNSQGALAVGLERCYFTPVCLYWHSSLHSFLCLSTLSIRNPAQVSFCQIFLDPPLLSWCPHLLYIENPHTLYINLLCVYCAPSIDGEFHTATALEWYQDNIHG